MKGQGVLSGQEILSILPHRYPFLLVDRILELDLEQGTILGLKNVTLNEPFFQGHFPNIPIMPGVLVLEALAQVSGILMHQKGYDKKIAVLLSVNQAKFRRPTFPGDSLYLNAECLHVSSKGGKMRTHAMVNDELVAEAEIGFAFLDKEKVS